MRNSRASSPTGTAVKSRPLALLQCPAKAARGDAAAASGLPLASCAGAPASITSGSRGGLLELSGQAKTSAAAPPATTTAAAEYQIQAPPRRSAGLGPEVREVPSPVTPTRKLGGGPLTTAPGGPVTTAPGGPLT